ncbi:MULTISPECIES: ABC transporter ATP-binding protein [Arthrobacter]|uniref:ABC transporter ATP-binding protein n=2 Tax=Arthrobacter TaxID=1663 RepID=A0ABU9KL50_9MICC|nr:ABC transporter ATP-binding protein [Arthrobacter sp. YJM1]MDP5227634.1 ABC transporter ATP-binding protein [Arthrobacter sp. YJM1]
MTPDPGTPGQTAPGQPAQAAPALDVAGLCVDVDTPAGRIRLLDDVSLTVRPGERLAVVGESGSGKSVMARSILRLGDTYRTTGSIKVAGTEVTRLSERQMSRLRGSTVAMVFQDPLGALNPLQTIGEQVAEPLRVRGTGRQEAERAAAAILEELGVARAAERMKAYPHEFSGGMRQRVVLAMALIAEPQLLIADEPTTALDVRVQEQVIDLLHEVSTERNLAVILITHDLGIVAGFADRVAVMYAGRKIQDDDAGRLFREPAHPYARGLIEAVPRIDHRIEHLVGIPGVPPHPGARPSGCAYHPRCPFRMDICEVEVPAERPLPSGGTVACHLFALEGNAS